MNLTENFTLEELIKTKHKVNNEPDEAQKSNLTYLAVHLLQPLRNAIGAPVIITSGFRSPELNKAVAGSPTSFHVLGCAADIKLRDGTFWHLFEYIHNNLPYTELIAENLPNGWCHVALQEGRENEKQLKLGIYGRKVTEASYDEITRFYYSMERPIEEK